MVFTHSIVSVGNRRGPPPPAPKARAREEPEEVRDERRRRRAQYKNTKAALQAATAGRPQAATVRAAAGRAWATRIACLLRVGDENSMLAAERRDRESAEFGEMKREAGGLGEFLLCPQGKAASPRFMGVIVLGDVC